MKNITAVYPGTFDPITHGHSDLIQRATKIFSKIIVAIAPNAQKNTLFTSAERENLAKEVLSIYPNVEICTFDSLLVDFTKSCNAQVILRGLRAVSDFEYEFQLASMNRKLSPDIETLFLTPSEQYAYISASLVKEIAFLGGNVSEFVHPCVEAALNEHRAK